MLGLQRGLGTWCLLTTSLCARNQVLGVGAPHMSLLDPSNPETGGVWLEHIGAAASDSDPFWCQFNPATGAQVRVSFIPVPVPYAAGHARCPGGWPSLTMRVPGAR